MPTEPVHDGNKIHKSLAHGHIRDIRAIQKLIPEIEVYYGHFLSHEVKAPVADPSATKRFETIIKTEEKGSDVNLAVHLLNDAWLDRYDAAVVVSNDSDLTEAMRLAKEHHSQTVVGLITPGEGKTSRQLQKHAGFVRHIRRGALARSMLPHPIPGTLIHKPLEW